MKKLTASLLLCGIALCGCARQYVMKLSNGHEITTASKPKLKGASYHWKDAKGIDNQMPAGRVQVIEPASMAAEEKKPPTISPPKKTRHWYFLWLA